MLHSLPGKKLVITYRLLSFITKDKNSQPFTNTRRNMVSVIIPTLNEENRIGTIIDYLKSQEYVKEIIIIDDGSVDNTVEVAKMKKVKVALSSMLGKGASMEDGLSLAQSEIVLFLDGDIFDFSNNLVSMMIKPLIDNDADFVKGKFQRQAGRVTLLTAIPLLKIFFPMLSSVSQPLGGIVAGKKELLKQIKFETDYGVDIGLLIDIHQLGARVVEVDIGEINHDHQDLNSLSKMSDQVVRTILSRSILHNRLSAVFVKKSLESERISRFEYLPMSQKFSQSEKIALFDMDNTLLEGSFLEHLAQFSDRTEELNGILGNHQMNPVQRTKIIARIISGIPKSVFEKIARSIPLRPGAQETIVDLKKRGYHVGIITDSYYIVAEIVRRRVFADFSIAHTLNFNKNTSSGDITLSPFMTNKGGCSIHPICKSNFIVNLEKALPDKRFFFITTGDGENDICLFKKVNLSFSTNTINPAVINASNFNIKNLNDLTSHL